jgi:hypothetical protein
VNKREHEGSSLSASGSGLGENIFSSQGKGNRLCLDRGGFREVEFGKTTKQTVVEPEVCKCEVVVDSVGSDLGSLSFCHGLAVFL